MLGFLSSQGTHTSENRDSTIVTTALLTSFKTSATNRSAESVEDLAGHVSRVP
ncbi:hypothetical protein AtNW77_Chr1g0022891 [Arabidopsis thaliana]